MTYINKYTQTVLRRQQVSFKTLLNRLSLVMLCLGFWTSGAVAQVTVNPGGGSYATLNAAFAAINAGTHTGAITISITGNTTEPAVSVPLLKSGGTSNYTSILIMPSGGNWTINSAAAPTASRGVIELYGADNVTIDGDDPGTAGTRNLSFVVTPVTTTGVAAIRLASTSTTGTDGADNNTIKNCIITGSRSAANSTTTNYGINMSNSSLITTGAYSSLNTLIENNLITRCYQGIFAIGVSATYPNTGTIIRNNTLGSSVAADNIGGRGINITYSSVTAGAGSAIIEGNDIRVGDVSPTGSGYGASIGGIEVGTANSGLKIRRNNIHDILQPNTSGWGAYGINVSGSANCDNIEISNNYIVNIVGIRYTSTHASTFVAYGIRYNAGATLQKINYNTIYIPLTTVGTVANYVNYGVYLVSTATVSEFRNNIIVNNNIGTGTVGVYAAATANISAGTVNYNDYYVPSGLVGFYSANQTTLANWQTATGKDANSISVLPGFASTSDFHILVSSTSVNALGTPVAGISTDFDGNTRDAATPDIGADEYTPLVCLGAAGGTITPATVSRCDGQTYNMSSVGFDVGAGITYQWEISATGGGVGFSNVSGGSGANTVSYTTSALTPGVYYYRLRVDCSNGPVTGYSNELTVTVNANPTVSVDVPTANYCNPNGTAVTINASGASTYAWLPAAGLNAASGSTVVATPATTTTYTVTGTDGNGCTATATSVITVQAGMSISTITATPATVCNGANSQLEVIAAAAEANTAGGTIYTATTGSLESIPSPVSVTTPTTGTIDDGFEPVNTTGSFVFNYNGTNYDNFVISTNGYVLMGATAPALNGIVTALTSTVLNGFNAVIGYGRDGNINVTNGGSINHGLDASGTKYVFEYFNFATASGGAESATQYATFQIVLWGNTSTTPGKIELIYGTSVGTSTTAACIGLRDASGTTAFKNGLTGSSTVSSTTTTFPVDQTMFSFERQTYMYDWTPSAFIAGQEDLYNPVATGVTATTPYAVTVTAANGCSTSGNVTVTAEPLACTPATAGPVNCANTNFTVTANHSGGGAPYSYSWNDGVGGVYPNSASITVNLPEGSYTLSCTVSDACGSNCTSAVSVTVNANPVTTVTPNTGLICNPGGSPITLDAAGATTYAWSPASGLSATTGGTVSANPATTTTYTVTGTDVNGCTSTASSVITVNTKANIAVTAVPATICSGASSTLTATSGTTGSATVGTITTSIGGNTGNPYRSGNGTGNQIRTQLLYTAAELIAAGVQPGPLSSIGFTTQSSSTGTVVNLTIGLGSTNVTALTSTFETTPVTTVFTQASFTPLSAGLNNHVFNAGTFTWDGVSNILVNVCQTNSLTGTATVSAYTPATVSNNHRATSVTACTDLTGTTVTTKPIVTFGWTSNTNLFTWSWEPGSLSGNSVSVSPANTTTYTVTATSADGCTSTSTALVTVNPNVTYYQDADNDSYGNFANSQVSCFGAPVGYVVDNTDCNDANAGVNPGATEVCNSIDDDCDGSTDEGFDLDNDGFTTCTGDCDDNNNTVYPGAVEFCNGIDDDCDGLTDDNTIALSAPAPVSGTATACLPGIAGTATFSTSAVANATGYAWSVPAGMTITSGQGTTSISVAYTATAIQAGIVGQICVYANNACVNSPSTCVNVDYQVAAPVTPNSISGPGKVCPGDVAVYSVAAVTRASGYTWSVPATMSIVSGQGTNVVSVQVNAGYTGGSITVVATNVCGSSPARSKSLTQNLPATPTAIAGQKEGLCNSTGNVFSIPPVAAATSYNWGATGATITGGNGTNSITADVATLVGTGSITVQAMNGCGSSLTRTLTISGAPARAGVISGSVSVCDNTNEAYSVATVAGAATYTWSVTANGAIATGQGTKNITVDWGAPAAGQNLNVVTSNACGSSLTRALTGITVNNCVRVSDQASLLNMVVMPNPATTYAQVQFVAPESGNAQLRITDMSGRVVYMSQQTCVAGTNSVNVDLSEIASGLYMVSLELNGEQQLTRLIVE